VAEQIGRRLPDLALGLRFIGANGKIVEVEGADLGISPVQVPDLSASRAARFSSRPRISTSSRCTWSIDCGGCGDVFGRVCGSKASPGAGFEAPPYVWASQ